MTIAVNSAFRGQAISGSAMRLSRLSIHIYAIIVVLLATTLIRFAFSYGTDPLLKTLVVIFEHRLWRGAMQFFTAPVLFLLVHIVVLSILVSSGAAYNAVTDVTKEEKLQSVGIAAEINFQRVSSPHKQNITTATLGCGPQLDNNADSKVFSSSANANPTQRQDCGLNRRNHTSRKTIAQTLSKAKKSASTATRRTKSEKDSASLPSRVIVRDVFSGEANSDKSGVSYFRQEVLVMDKDELNERIEAFFARFREQLRQESLNSQ